MAYVERRSGEGIDKLLKRFRRKLQQSGQLSAYRRKRYFISKGEARREKERRAERRRRRRDARRRGRQSDRHYA